MKEVGKWVSLTVKDGTIVRARRVPWRTQMDDGKWVDSENIALVIQRIKDGVESLKIDEPEGIALRKILNDLFTEGAA